MFSSVRRGHVLGRALRTCIPRSVVVSRVAQRSSISSELPRTVAAVAHKRALHAQTQRLSAQAQAILRDQEDQEPSSGLITRFSDLAAQNHVSPKIINMITQGMGIETMTEVQSQTITTALQGTDLLAKAKTGTGKTLAFLIPVVQNIMKDPTLGQKSSRYMSSADDIRAIIISPTRELAEQIAAEAQKIVRNTGVIVQTAVGGTRKREGLQRIQRNGCHILVGTPGRLNDIFSDERFGVSAPKLSALVLDEADRLLDGGFAPEIDAFQRLLPNRKDVDRQTLMFSATVPREVMDMVRSTMKPNYKYVNTVPENEVPTHVRVPQRLVYLRGIENQLPAITEIAHMYTKKHLEDQTNTPPFKAIVYFNSTAEAALARMAFYEMRVDPSDNFSEHPLRGLRIIEMHARLTQAQRTNHSEAFRRAKSAILFSSDVTARGMDFPGVTHVIQCGVPRDRDTYIHRLGRTARANKTGEGWLLCADFDEAGIRRKLRDLPLKEENTLGCASADMTQASQLPSSVATILSQTTAAFKNIHMDVKNSTYRSMLGTIGPVEDKVAAIRAMNQACVYGWGLPSPPRVSPEFVNKMGYRGLGLNVGGASGGMSARTGPGGLKGSYQQARAPFRSPFGSDRSSPRDRSFGERGASTPGRQFQFESRSDSRGSGGFRRHDRTDRQRSPFSF